jgi:hypothetical protein
MEDDILAVNIFSSLIGRSLKDENSREIGRIVSFIIDSSGAIKEVLVENKSEEMIKYPIERLKASEEEVLLVADVNKRAEKLCEDLPILLRKREILESLFKNREIMPEIYECLSAELDKLINDMKLEAQNLLSDIESQIQCQENFIKMLHLARTFLEMEHGIGNVRDDVFRQSLLSILREIKYASYRKANLLKVKDRVSNLTLQIGVNVTVGEKPVINVHVTER